MKKKMKNEKSEKKKAPDLGDKASPIHTQRFKSQYYENSSSTSLPYTQQVAPALSLSCTLSSHLTSLITSFGPGVLVSRGGLTLLPQSSRLCFAASLSTRTFDNTLLPMLQMAGTTVCRRRKLFNRLKSISLFSSLPLEAS